MMTFEGDEAPMHSKRNEDGGDDAAMRGDQIVAVCGRAMMQDERDGKRQR